MIDELHVTEALLGSEKRIAKRSNLGKFRLETIGHYQNGVWNGAQTGRNAKISAVLVARQLRPWNIAQSKATIYHNPWPKTPFPSDLQSLPHAMFNHGKWNHTEGSSFASILNL
jgi:hypothetical protein